MSFLHLKNLHCTPFTTRESRRLREEFWVNSCDRKDVSKIHSYGNTVIILELSLHLL